MGIEHEIRVTVLNPTTSDGMVDVSLVGEFDLSTAGELRESFIGLELLNASRVQVDLTHVSFLDSTTTGLLVAACKKVRSTGGTFSVSCSGPALQLLEVSGLTDFLEVQAA